MNPKEIFSKLIKQNVIKPHTSNSDSDSSISSGYEPPLVKRRRIEDENKKKISVPPFSGIDETAGPSNPQIAVKVKPVRRRLSFSEPYQHETESEESDESVPNPFKSDSSSSDSNSSKDYTQLTPVVNPAAPAVPTTSQQQEFIEFTVPLPISPLPQSPAETASTTAKTGRQAIASQKGKHPIIINGCNCKNKCEEKIEHNQREFIHAQYWSHGYQEQRNWLLNNSVKTSLRNRDYFLMDSSNTRIKVCARFFLRTLGYTSNSVINCLTKQSSEITLFAPSDKRGKHRPAHALDITTQKTIDEHIESFHPTCSHYRRAHAPNRRYLSPDLSIRDMHRYYLESNPHKISYETYRNCVAKKGISFARLGTEECEQCLQFKMHEHDEPTEHKDCEICVEQNRHRSNYTISRIHYQRDSGEDSEGGTTRFVSADMQKVIMLPYMLGIKSCVFTNRLVAFHETFAPLGRQRSKTIPRQVLSVLWHEAISGRSACDVTSVFIRAVKEMAEEAKHIVIWCDNCAAQNKNWTLFTSLVRFLNISDEGPVPTSVTLKYLETGHTYMSADSFHGMVEKNMKKMDKVYNFHDFVSVIQTCGGAPKTIEMQFYDFRNWDKRVTGGKNVKVPYLKNIQVAKFTFGSKLLHFKESHDEENFQQCDFLMKRVQKEIDQNISKPERRSSPRGIPEWKKNGIIRALGDMMPDTKIMFWKHLPTDNSSVDLINDDNDTLNDDI